jgi:hypothetical protein
VIEEAVALAEAKTGKRSGGGTKNKIEFLEQASILSTDEQAAFLSAWGFLSSGNHPGLSSDEEGRIGMILCLEFIQILAISKTGISLAFLVVDLVPVAPGTPR